MSCHPPRPRRRRCWRARSCRGRASCPCPPSGLVAAADQALDSKDRALRIGDRLALGRLTDEAFAVIRKGDDRRRGTHPLGVLDDLRGLALHHRDTGIGGAEIDPDHFAHGTSSLRQQAVRALFGTRREDLRDTCGSPRPTPRKNVERRPLRRLRSYRRAGLRRKTGIDGFASAKDLTALSRLLKKSRRSGWHVIPWI